MVSEPSPVKRVNQPISKTSIREVIKPPSVPRIAVTAFLLNPAIIRRTIVVIRIEMPRVIGRGLIPLFIKRKTPSF